MPLSASPVQLSKKNISSPASLWPYFWLYKYYRRPFGHTVAMSGWGGFPLRSLGEGPSQNRFFQYTVTQFHRPGLHSAYLKTILFNVHRLQTIQIALCDCPVLAIFYHSVYLCALKLSINFVPYLYWKCWIATLPIINFYRTVIETIHSEMITEWQPLLDLSVGQVLMYLMCTSLILLCANFLIRM